MGNWAEMVPDLLTMIVSRLNLFQELLAFRGVCTSWRNITRMPKKVHRPPLLMLNSIGKADFYSLTKKKTHRILFPEVYKKRYFETLGWLVSEDIYTGHVELYNPVTNDRVPLLHRYNQSDVDSNIIHKAVLSTSPSFAPTSFELGVIYGNERELGFWSFRSQSWSYERIISTLKDIQDLLFYKDQFYALDKNGKVYVLEINLDGTVKLVKCWRIPVSLIRNKPQCYLVDDNDTLLIVFGVYGHTIFEMYQIDNSRSVFKAIRDLGSRSLFVGGDNSFLVDTCIFPGIQPNSIYYTNDPRYGLTYDMGIYNLQKEHTECYIKPSSSNFSRPVWFSPSL